MSYCLMLLVYLKALLVCLQAAYYLYEYVSNLISGDANVNFFLNKHNSCKQH